MSKRYTEKEVIDLIWELADMYDGSYNIHEVTEDFIKHRISKKVKCIAVITPSQKTFRKYCKEIGYNPIKKSNTVNYVMVNSIYSTRGYTFDGMILLEDVENMVNLDEVKEDIKLRLNQNKDE